MSERNLPARRGGKLALLLVAVLAGCGGSAHKTVVLQSVRGPGYRFQTLPGWSIARKAHVVTATRPGSATDLISVSTYRLPKVPTVAEIDAAARSLALTLHGKLDAKSVVRVAGKPARRYDLSYRKGGQDLGLRLVFVLRGKREFQLLCRWQSPPDGDLTQACDALARTFRPS